MTGYTTRIAPSPTGDMHLGTARTAYFNWLMARASGGKFILRIDDTDLARNDQKHIDIILETMEWLGLTYDELEYQSKRIDVYYRATNDLVKKGFTTTLENGAIAVNLSSVIDFPTTWRDEISGDINITSTNHDQTDGMILIKGNGYPGYNWASVVDDVDLGVDYIIRGHDHITNTSSQAILYKLLDKPLPKFAHVGLIHANKKKMSKRDGAASMMQYKADGYDPDALLNFMLRLGWGPTIDDKTTKTIDKDRALELFINGGRMRSAPSNLDTAMLNSYDRKYKARKK